MNVETVARVDLEISQGDDFSLPLQILNEDDAGDQTPFNLTGCTLAAQVRRKHTDAAALLTFTVTVDNAAQGEFTLSIPRASTAAVSMTDPEEIAYWDLELTNGSNKTTKIMRGRVVLVAEYTK
jgi:hypothetical protein